MGRELVFVIQLASNQRTGASLFVVQRAAHQMTVSLPVCHSADFQSEGGELVCLSFSWFPIRGP